MSATTLYLDRGSRAMPAMSRIAAHWRDHSEGLVWLRSHDIGWGEPFCFACGWLAPISSSGIPSDTPPDTCLVILWRRASPWLDRAHLQDRCAGGPDAPDNLVPLCHLCHAEMTEREFFSREAGLAWVRTHTRCEASWQAYTDAHLMGYTPSRSTLYRARARYADLMLTVERQIRQRDSPPGSNHAQPSRAANLTNRNQRARAQGLRSPTG